MCIGDSGNRKPFIFFIKGTNTKKKKERIKYQMHLKPCQVSMLYPLRTQCGDGDGDFDFDSEPPPSSLISTGDGDAGVMTSMLSNVPMFTADNCLMVPNLIGDGDLDGGNIDF